MKSLNRFAVLIGVVLLLALARPLCAQIRLEHADSSTALQVPGGAVYEFFGSVHFIRDSSQLFSDYAARYEPQNIVRLIGNVRIKEPQRELAADSVWYYQSTDLMRAWGRVAIEDHLRHVKAEGGAADYDGKEEYLLLMKNPRLTVDFDIPHSSTFVKGDTIKYHARDDMVEAIDSATIVQGTLIASAQQATIYLDREEMCLTGKVHATQHQNELSGDAMTVYSKSKKLERINVVGNGESIFRQRAAAADTLVYNESRLTANKIDFFFANDLLDLIKAQGNSYTYYLPAKEDTISKGSNVASGDSTTLKFLGGELSEVFVVTSAEGTYWSPAGRDSLGNPTRMDTVTYSANRINYKIAHKQIFMKETARVKQATMNLDAHEIQYDLTGHNVYAYGFYDTAQSAFVPLTLKDKAEEMTGERLVYNLDTKRGKIKESHTTLEQAYYSGGVLRKEVEGQVLVRNGSYTTCDLAEPHFHFASKDMKLITNDKVFARPVILYVESMPVFALPYFVFSTKKGRQSGFLPFQFGNFERGQRFVNNLGYYWAISDYWDVKGSVDVHEGTGLTFNGAARYAIRNNLNGYVSGSFARETRFLNVQRTTANRYRFSFSHSQQIDPTLSLSGSGEFLSDKSYYTDYSTNLDQRLNRNIHSQININKRWEGASLTVAVDQTKALDLDTHAEKLPVVRFSLSQKPLFHQPKKATDKRWYHDMYYGYNSGFLNSSAKGLSGQLATFKKYSVLNQQFDLRAPIKFFNAVTVSPAMSLFDNWYYLPPSDQADSAHLATRVVRNRDTWTSSVTLSTVLYGSVAPHMFSIVGLRHVMSPSVSIGYQPKITHNQDYAGFTGFGGSGFESKNLNFGLQNQFQMKYLKGGKEQKLDLFRYSLSGNYDFVRKQRRWSTINSALSAYNVKNMTLDVSFVHDLYASNGKLRWWNPTLTSISISTGYRGSFKIPIGMSQTSVLAPSAPVSPMAATPGPDLNRVTFGISERYTETRGVYGSVQHWISFDLGFSPSKNWRVKYRQNYNIRARGSSEKTVEIYRDLHCWEGTFTWIPEGSLQGYYFRINVKLMPDLKFEKSESGIRDALLGLNPYQ